MHAGRREVDACFGGEDVGRGRARRVRRMRSVDGIAVIRYFGDERNARIEAERLVLFKGNKEKKRLKNKLNVLYSRWKNICTAEN